ncbi:MAG: pentapeptide repeat-containing protein [Alphaproteobacteria bacterium]
MSENDTSNTKPQFIKVEPKRPVIVRMVKARPVKKKIENNDHKLVSDIVAGVRLGNSFSGNEFGALDLSNYEMLKGMFAKAKLRGSDFSGSNLTDSNFEKADLAYADFSGATLKGVNFKGADLTGVDFSNANLEGANLAGAIIKDITICNTNLSGVKLTKTVREELQRIREAMKEIDLTKVDLTKIDLRLIDFKNVDLRGVDLTGIDLSGVNLVGVNLSGAKIDFSQIDGSRFMRGGPNNRVKISKGNLAGLDPLTVNQIQNKERQEHIQKEQQAEASKESAEQAEKIQKHLDNEIDFDPKKDIARPNSKRPPYKVKEEDYVESKYDFPDVHSSLIEREMKRQENELAAKDGDSQISEDIVLESEADNDMVSTPKNKTEDAQEDTSTSKPRRFFPRILKKGRSSKVKVRS